MKFVQVIGMLVPLQKMSEVKVHGHIKVKKRFRMKW